MFYCRWAVARHIVGRIFCLVLLLIKLVLVTELGNQQANWEDPRIMLRSHGNSKAQVWKLHFGVSSSWEHHCFASEWNSHNDLESSKIVELTHFILCSKAGISQVLDMVPCRMLSLKEKSKKLVWLLKV